MADKWLEGSGPAFPITTASSTSYKGMSLRDWFAGQALAGILSNPQAMTVLATDIGIAPNGFSITAEKVYEIADAMLKEREK